MRGFDQSFPGFAVSLAFMIGAAVTVLADVIHVPAEQPTIQDGLNAASSGDTVLVSPGTYYENIIWPEVNGIRLIGHGRDSTTIDGNSTASVIRFETASIIDASTIVDGFTITNGSALPPWPESQGGGIFLSYANPILRNLTVRGNFADDFGGGIYSWNASPTISHVVIDSNTAISRGGFVCYGGHPTLDHVTVSRNDPGGLYFETSSLPLLINSIVAFNGTYQIEIYGTSFQPTRIRMGYSDIFGNVFLIGYASIDSLEGNIDANPLFVDTNSGDFHLLPESPCIDAGDPSYPLDPDSTITDMGVFYFAQVRLYVTPDSVDFGLLDVGDNSTTVISLQNPSDQSIAIDGVFHMVTDFIIDTTGLGGQVDPQSTYEMTAAFVPSAVGTYIDTLVILAQQDGDDMIRIPLYGEADVIPMPVESLVIQPGPMDGIELHWQPVTHTISGQPISVLYIIYGATSPEGQFQPFGFTPDTSYVHPYVLNTQEKYFYYVTALPADALRSPEIDELLRSQQIGE